MRDCWNKADKREFIVLVLTKSTFSLLLTKVAKCSQEFRGKGDSTEGTSRKQGSSSTRNIGRRISRCGCKHCRFFFLLQLGGENTRHGWWWGPLKRANGPFHRQNVHFLQCPDEQHSCWSIPLLSWSAHALLQRWPWQLLQIDGNCDFHILRHLFFTTLWFFLQFSIFVSSPYVVQPGGFKLCLAATKDGHPGQEDLQDVLLTPWQH